MPCDDRAQRGVRVRIVIVEDEETTRRGLTGVLERFTKDEIVGYAANGREGIVAIKELSPDLVITDIRMPVLSGLKMLEILEQEGHSVNAIVLSGYSDFEYARSAVHLGVTEYLLKPLEIEELLAALERIREKLAKNRREVLSPEVILREYITHPEQRTKEERLRLAELLHIGPDTQLGCCIAAPESAFRGMLSAVGHCVQERMESFCFEKTYAVTLPEHRVMVLVIGVENDVKLREKLEVKVVPELRNIAPCRCVYFCCRDLEKMCAEIARLSLRMEEAFYEPIESCVDLQKLTEAPFSAAEYPSEEENRALTAYRGGRREEAEHWGQKLLERLCERKTNPGMVKEYSTMFLATLYRSIRNIDGDVQRSEGETSFQSTQAYTNMMNAENAEMLREYYLQLLHWMLERRDIKEAEDTDNGIILNAIAYIRTHYSEDVSLTEAAEVCGVSQAHLSRLFVSEMGVNFNPFLQNYRISMAKRFLKERNATVAAVSEQVGFRDQRYFIKVFKKLCGMTPKEYQRECGC